MRRPPAPHLQSVRIKNFKAIQDSGIVRFTPLTVFIGNNGVGKSSLVEALETLQILAFGGADEAMARWKGIEHVTNKFAKPTEGTTPPIGFYLQGRLLGGWADYRGEVASEKSRARSATVVAADRNFSHPRIIEDWIKPFGSHQLIRPQPNDLEPSVLARIVGFGDSLARWQFLLINPDVMGELKPATRLGARPKLARDANNIAAYLKSIYDADLGAFEGLVDTMRYVVPYARGFNHEQTQELVRNDYITLAESGFKVPGWMISTGTLRVLAILACLRHPEPPQLLVVEEIENGLDPRTLSLVLDEIMDATNAGRTQVIVTTHSPTLLDQVPLECIVTVERHDGQPVFHRPADDSGLAEWRKEFLPGQLYTMGRFRRNKR